MYDACDVPLLPGSHGVQVCEICHGGRPINSLSSLQHNGGKVIRGAARKMFGRIVHISCLNPYLVNTEKAGITPGMISYIHSLPVRRVNNHYKAIGVGLTRGCNEDVRKAAGLSYIKLSDQARKEELFPCAMSLEHFVSNPKFRSEIEASRTAARLHAIDASHAEKSLRKYTKELGSTRQYEIYQEALVLMGKKYVLELERSDDYAKWITPEICSIGDGWGVFLLNALCQKHPSQSDVIRCIFRADENGMLDFDSKLEEVSRVGEMKEDACRFLQARRRMKTRRIELEPVVKMTVEKWLAQEKAPLYFRRSCLSFSSAQDCVLGLKVIQENPDLCEYLEKVFTLPLFPEKDDPGRSVFGDELCLNASIRRLAVLPDPMSISLFDDVQAMTFARDFLEKRIKQEVQTITGIRDGAWEKFTGSPTWLWEKCWAFQTGKDFILAYGKVRRYVSFLGSDVLQVAYQVDQMGAIDLGAAHGQLGTIIDRRLEMRVAELVALGDRATTIEKLQLEYCLNKRKMLALPKGNDATAEQHGELQCRLGIDRMIRLEVLGESATKEQKQELKYLKFKVNLVMQRCDMCGNKRKR